MTGPYAQSQLGEAGAYGETNLTVALLGFVCSRLSREPLGARNGLPELEFQGTCARRVAGVQPNES